MNILQMSSTPMAGVPYLLRDIINKYSKHTCKTVTGASKYPDGRKWDKPDGNLANSIETRNLLTWAEVVILHNGGMHRVKTYDRIISGKRVIPYYHSEPSPPCPSRRVSRRWERGNVRAYVIAQGHSLMYPSLPTLPNLVDIHHPSMKPAKCGLAKPYIKIGYAPSNRQTSKSKHLEFMRLYRYSSKGWFYTKPILDQLAIIPGVVVKIFYGIPFWQCMEQRKDCDIFIDEVVTGSYHRSTLEAMSHRQVVINGISPQVEKLFLKAGGADSSPILKANHITLHSDLLDLIEDPKRIHDVKKRSRQWMENHWDPEKMLSKWYEPAFLNARKPK